MVDLSPHTNTTQLARIVWCLLLFIGLGYEFITLPTGHRDTLSHWIWDDFRWTNLRFVLLPAWCWLTWHWILRPQETVDYRDILALAFGFIWAILEHYNILSKIPSLWK